MEAYWTWSGKSKTIYPLCIKKGEAKAPPFHSNHKEVLNKAS